MTLKEQAIDALRSLPDDVSLEGIYARLEDQFLEGTGDSSLNETWIAEINRRVEELDQGKVKGIPAEEIFPELREDES